MGILYRGRVKVTTGRPWRDDALDAAVDAVRDGDVAAGAALLGETRDSPEFRALRVAGLAEAASGRSAAIRALAGADPQNPDLALWLGDTLIVEAWAIRSSLRARYVSREQFAGFHATLQTAHHPLLTAARLLPQDSVPWSFLLTFARGMELPRSDEDVIWKNLSERSPTLYRGACQRIQGLAKKWGGSHEDMLGFAREIAAAAHPGDPVTAMVALAHIEVALDNIAVGSDSRFTDYLGNPAVQWEVRAAAEKWCAAPRPHPYDIDAHHLFGFAFFQGGDTDRARFHLTVGGTRIPDVPWCYIAGDEASNFAKVCKRLKISL